MSLELQEFTILNGEKRPLFHPLSLRVGKGEIVTIMGSSGIGKSTLIDAIGGYLDPYFQCSGTVCINGLDIFSIKAHERKVGILFQDANLFPHLSVGQNIAFGLDSKIKGRLKRRNAIEEALKVAGLESFYPRDPASLSGGQKTRVALMRTLLSAPEVLLLDEPFSKLDPATKTGIREFVFTHIAEREIPTLIVTHDHDDVRGELVELTAPILDR